LTENELGTYVTKADSIVICLGHVLTFQGILGPPYRLVHDSTKSVTDSIQGSSSTNNENGKVRQVILMNSDGVVGL
jgi:hypothetical protein